jgi:protein SCO1
MVQSRSVLLGVSLLIAQFLPAVAEGHAAADHGFALAPSVAAKAEVGAGVEERLGAKIPLAPVFRDEAGKAVRLGALITGPTIILPVYYGCTNECNYLQGGLASVLPDIRPRPAADYRVISVSFDENDTAADALRTKRMFLGSFSAPFPAGGWRFLTGNAESIQALTQAAGYHFRRSGRDFVHPVASIVVARDGTIVRYLYGTNFLPKDLTLALFEARDGKVGATVRKMVDYCFSFDPAARGYQFNLLRVSATVIILCCGSFLLFLIIGGRNDRRKKEKRSR